MAKMEKFIAITVTVKILAPIQEGQNQGPDQGQGQGMINGQDPILLLTSTMSRATE